MSTLTESISGVLKTYVKPHDDVNKATQLAESITFFPSTESASSGQTWAKIMSIGGNLIGQVRNVETDRVNISLTKFKNVSGTITSMNDMMKSRDHDGLEAINIKYEAAVKKATSSMSSKLGKYVSDYQKAESDFINAYMAEIDKNLKG